MNGAIQSLKNSFNALDRNELTILLNERSPLNSLLFTSKMMLEKLSNADASKKSTCEKSLFSWTSIEDVVGRSLCFSTRFSVQYFNFPIAFGPDSLLKAKCLFNPDMHRGSHANESFSQPKQNPVKESNCFFGDTLGFSVLGNQLQQQISNIFCISAASPDEASVKLISLQSHLSIVGNV